MELEPDEVPAGAPEWMVTFADLMSLLLTFFVLLLSFSNMEIVKFRTMAGSVRNALGLKSEFDLSDITGMATWELPIFQPVLHHQKALPFAWTPKLFPVAVSWSSMLITTAMRACSPLNWPSIKETLH
jgi:hypothetical protein